jgi:hypothetical protein
VSKDCDFILDEICYQDFRSEIHRYVEIRTRTTWLGKPFPLPIGIRTSGIYAPPRLRRTFRDALRPAGGTEIYSQSRDPCIFRS